MHATAWMNLENFVKEASHKRLHITYVIPFIGNIQNMKNYRYSRFQIPWNQNWGGEAGEKMKRDY